MDVEYILKVRRASPLLPEPGPEVVVELCDELDRRAATIDELQDSKKGMDALRQVCVQHGGVPVEKQSSSSEDIALWADAAIKEQAAEIERLEIELKKERERPRDVINLIGDKEREEQERQT